MNRPFFDHKYNSSLSNITGFLFNLFTSLYKRNFSEQEIKNIFVDIYKLFDFTEGYPKFSSEESIFKNFINSMIKDEFINIIDILKIVKNIIEKNGGIEKTWDDLINKIYHNNKLECILIRNILNLIYAIYFKSTVERSKSNFDSINFGGVLKFFKNLKFDCNNKKQFTVMIIIVYFYDLINFKSKFSELLLLKKSSNIDNIFNKKSLSINLEELNSPTEKLLENQIPILSSNSSSIIQKSSNKRLFSSINESINNESKSKINLLVDSQMYIYDIESLIKKHKSLKHNIQSLLVLEENTLNEIEEKWSLLKDLLNK